LKLLLWAIEHSIAFSALDDDMFRGALEEFGVGVQSIPNRKQLVQEYLPLLSVLMHNLVDSKLQNASTVSITTDGWNNIRQQRFISITAHFIDDEWNLQKYVLEVAKVSEEHSGENIYNFLKVHLNHHLPKNCIQLCINDVIQNGQWAEDIECVQQIVTKVRMSPKLSEDFYQRQSGKNNTGLMLVQSCPTRWNSEYLMVHRFLKIGQVTRIGSSASNIS
jgi:hypothetical protein